MSIFIDSRTRVLVQGITGREGAFHARQMLEYGTALVAGVIGRSIPPAAVGRPYRKQ